MSPLLVLIIAGLIGVGLLVAGLARPGARGAGQAGGAAGRGAGGRGGAAGRGVVGGGRGGPGAAGRGGASGGGRGGRPRPSPVLATGRLPGLLGVFEPREEYLLKSLRLVGIRVPEFARQRLIGTFGGLAAGVILAILLGRGPLGTVILCLLVGAAGWFLPALGVRDTARKLRAEIDQIVRIWVVLVAQQVTAGIEPAAAMLNAAQAGSRPGWRLLYRFLVAAQNERRGTWEGLQDLVNRYGVRSLEVIVASLGLAAGRGTRLSDAILGSAESLWKESMARDREAANRRNQVVVVPATGVALALAGILVYPPFTSLSGGGIAGLG